MKKELLMISGTFLLLAGTAIAAPADVSHKDKLPKTAEVTGTPGPTHKLKPTINPSITPTCNPNEEWENHGAYVSCVAKLKLGGEYVSQAAQLTVGKKNPEKTETEDKDEKKHPTITPTITITITPTLAPTKQIVRTEIKGIMAELRTLLNKLHDLLPQLNKREK